MYPPPPPELHLYEGFVGRPEARSIWRTGLNMVGLTKSNAEEASRKWHLSARQLIDRIFQKWSPSEKASTDKLCENLCDFNCSLGSAHMRVLLQDRSPLPMIMVGGKMKDQSPFRWVPDGL